ncbi:MAG: type VI secretion system baseplate subunit TssG [Thermodesulfobacteriota bacterium]
MAAHGWRSSASVAEWLEAEGWRFDFYQALRLLEMARPWKSPLGEGVDRAREAVRITSRVSHAFPASDVQEVSPPGSAEAPARMEINVLGLAGALGPLPPPWTDLAVERLRQGDRVLADFLDIFNHRLASLLYRSRKALRPGFESRRPSETGVAEWLYALAGMATRGLRGNRLGLPDGALLRYAALLACEVRSAKGLELVLADHFGVPARVAPFTGGFVVIEPDERTRLGSNPDTAANNALGREAVLGSRAWDPQSAFRVELGPMRLPAFLELLPCSGGFIPLCGLARFFAGPNLEFDVVLRLEAAQIPALRLGREASPRLGWTTWLGAKPAVADGAVALHPRHWPGTGVQDAEGGAA